MLTVEKFIFTDGRLATKLQSYMLEQTQRVTRRVKCFVYFLGGKNNVDFYSAESKFHDVFNMIQLLLFCG